MKQRPSFGRIFHLKFHSESCPNTYWTGDAFDILLVGYNKFRMTSPAYKHAKQFLVSDMK